MDNKGGREKGVRKTRKRGGREKGKGERVAGMNKVTCTLSLSPPTRGDGVDEEDTSGGGLVDEVGQLVCLLQGIQLPPTRPVLVVILRGIQVGVHTPFTHSGWDGTEV